MRPGRSPFGKSRPSDRVEADYGHVLPFLAVDVDAGAVRTVTFYTVNSVAADPAVRRSLDPDAAVIINAVNAINLVAFHFA